MAVIKHKPIIAAATLDSNLLLFRNLNFGVNSTPSDIQVISSKSETEIFDYRVPASCFGLDDFSEVSYIGVDYIIPNVNITNNTNIPKNTLDDLAEGRLRIVMVRHAHHRIVPEGIA